MNDLRYVVRTLLRQPGFTAIVVLTLALGIGATTAIFSVVNGVLLRPLPYPDSDDLIHVATVFPNGGSGNVSYPSFQDLREQNATIEALAVYQSGTASAVVAGEGFRVAMAEVSADVFAILGVQPILGRVFRPEEERAGERVAVVSHGYWQSRLGATRELGDQVVQLGDHVYTISGVMPRGFDFPLEVDVWVPRRVERRETRTAYNWQVIGRLKDGVSIELAGRDLSAIARRLKEQHGDDTQMVDALVVPMQEQLVGRVRPALMILLGAAGFLLLVACANVVNLLLARGVAAQRELAVRLALGAGATRLARQFLAESLVLSLAGGLLGVVLAVWGVQALLTFEPGQLPRADQIGVDWAVLTFALCVSVLVALAVGLVPAIDAARRDVRASLAESQRTHAGGLSSQRVRSVLVASQVALTIVLLVGAGLLARSFLRLIAVDPGFRTHGAIVMDLWLPSPSDQAGEASAARFHEMLIERLRAIPGLARVGGVNAFPLGGNYSNGTFLILSRPDEVVDMEGFRRLAREPSRRGHAEFRIASGGYFDAMEIPLVRGRLFDDRDGPDAPHVAVISESLAKATWPGDEPIGKLIQFGNMDGDPTPFTIVGIVGDIRERSLASEPRPTFYGYYRQRPGSAYRFHIVVQGSADPAAVTASARRFVLELNPEIPLRFRTIEGVFSASLADRRFVVLLLGLFGVLALVLAAMGVYGVIAYLLSQRTREIGIRMALGAKAGDVVRLLVGQGAVLTMVGIGAGLAAAFALTRVLRNQLFAVGTTDPVSFAGTSVLLLMAALLASWIPARRAARVDPMEALRYE